MAAKRKMKKIKRKAPSVKFIGCKRKEKFHSPQCTYAQYLHGFNRVDFKSEKDARAAGFIPCGICLSHLLGA